MGMSLTLEKIEKSINAMDNTYDANFGDWIRNEDNCKIISHHLKKYTLEYPSHDFVVVLKWTVKDWTLRSIIILCKMMIVADIETAFDRKMEILQGLIFTWHPAFVAEFILSTSKMIRSTLKASYCSRLLEDFESDRVKIIIAEMGDKIDSELKESVVSILAECKTKKRCVKRKRLIDAYQIL